MNPKPEVLVIGGGVIGLSAAYDLSARGASVTVIDQGEIGHGCSYGNAGWLTPCFSMPLPMPGMLLKSVGWLLDPDSPLRIKPQPSLMLARWLLRFLASMNQKQASRSIAALTELSRYSLNAYKELNQKYPDRFGFTQKGLLMVSATQDGLRAATEEMHLVAGHGVPGQALNEDEVRTKEPALKARLKGGVYFPAEAHAEPFQVVQMLKEAAAAQGAQISPRTEVFDFEIDGTQGGKITRVRTTRGEFEPRQIVLAAGTWSGIVARKLALRVPILGGKGYSIVMKPFAGAPTHPIMVVERKIAVTPHAGSFRLAGTLELVDEADHSITPRRLDAILSGGKEYLTMPEQPEIVEIWRGLRPCTPDGVPLIGRTRRHPNLVVAAGHQMLGLQSSLGTGRLVGDLVTGAKPSFDPAPFDADRF